MKQRIIKNLPFKRKRLGKTNYKKRLSILKSKQNRLVIRRSLNHITIQVIRYEKKGDKILISSHSSEIKKLGWKFHTGNIPCSYLTGYLLGTKAKKQGIKEAILDLGLHSSTKGSRIYSALKGVIDGGLNVKYSDKVLPDEKRIKGEHISTHFELVKKGQNKNQFNKYIKSNTDPKEIGKNAEDIKTKIGK